MKKLYFGMLLVSSAVLTACGGGESDSSYNVVFKQILPNQNEYTCPTQTAFDSCKDDNSCKVAKCTLTKEVTKVVDITTLKACESTGANVYATLTGCRTINTNVRTDAVLVCSPNKSKIYITGYIAGSSFKDTTINVGSNLNGVRYFCR